jgi:Protein of unknown function (DUF4199)
MKRIVWTFGLISGGILSAMMVVAMRFHDAIGFDRGVIIGYTTMVAAFLLVFFGVRAYRDNVGGGTVSFGRALAVGSLIALIASMCYVATWEVIYYNFMPDYLQKYQAHALEKAKSNGASQAEIDKQMAEMKKFEQMYQNPAVNMAMTFVEPLPVGLAFALLSAVLLRLKRRETAAGSQISTAGSVGFR